MEPETPRPSPNGGGDSKLNLKALELARQTLSIASAEFLDPTVKEMILIDQLKSEIKRLEKTSEPGTAVIGA